MNAPIQITEVGVDALVQLIRKTLGQSVADNLPGAGGLLQVHGTLGTLRHQQNYQRSYKIKLNGGSDEIIMEMSNDLIRRLRLKGGENVIATGLLKTDFTRYTDHQVTIKLDVADMKVLEQDGASDQVRSEKATLAHLKGLGARRIAFPTNPQIRLSVVMSRCGQSMVDQDFLHEIDKLGDRIVVDRIPVNILSVDEIAAGIRQAAGDIVAIIRGGGDETQFDVFDSVEVLEAIAQKNAYRVVGLGHTANRTLLDLVADFSANTPTHAGVHIREMCEVVSQDLRTLQFRVLEVERQLNATAVDLQQARTREAAAHDLVVLRDREISRLQEAKISQEKRQPSSLWLTLLTGAILGAIGLGMYAKYLH